MALHPICTEHFAYFQARIIESWELWKWKSPRWLYRRYQFLKASQNERISDARMIAVETLLYIIENDKWMDYEILKKIDDKLWHLLLIWFSEAP